MDTWFVLYCKPGKDGIAETNLLNQKIDVYRPRIYLTQARRDRARIVRTDSLFPRYLFVNVNPEDRLLTPIGYTRGVVGFVKFGGQYSTINDEIISSIKACELNQQEGLTSKHSYTKGDLIYINGGSFIDIKATFVEKRGCDRVAVLLDILGRTSEISVPSSYVSRSSVY